MPLSKTTAGQSYVIVTYIGSTEHRDWFRSLCGLVGADGPAVVQMALKEFAEKRCCLPMTPRLAERKPRATATKPA